MLVFFSLHVFVPGAASFYKIRKTGDSLGKYVRLSLGQARPNTALGPVCVRGKAGAHAEEAHEPHTRGRQLPVRGVRICRPQRARAETTRGKARHIPV